ncbi:hypothetical protein JTE90_003790 [Oedothorax gibbosus]|uniref:Uncharacterized protein n=1 Tax=Oedothorax gibbosus TaxID=931172 RepID=A0AAV6V9H5_9ARAC|nr:hypothetical protein JTE90_003790 [Oedothorax gibbosus]
MCHIAMPFQPDNQNLEPHGYARTIFYLHLLKPDPDKKPYDLILLKDSVQNSFSKCQKSKRNFCFGNDASEKCVFDLYPEGAISTS